MQTNNFEKAYDQAFELARQQLLGRDVVACCESAGSVLIEKSRGSATLELQYLNTSVRLVLPACSCITADRAELHTWDKILLLHYLTRAQSESTTAREISFKELKTASLYYQSFEGRCLIPLMKTFGSQPEQLVENAQALGGQALQAGDAGVRLQVLPKVSVSCIIWKSDDEFPASASILFDSTIEQYLFAEDIVVLCQRMVLKLLKKW